jgi:hypothetical protein
MRIRTFCAGLAALALLPLAGCCCHKCGTRAERPVIVGSAPVACPAPCPAPCPCPNPAPAAVPAYSSPAPCATGLIR